MRLIRYTARQMFPPGDKSTVEPQIKTPTCLQSPDHDHARFHLEPREDVVVPHLESSHVSLRVVGWRNLGLVVPYRRLIVLILVFLSEGVCVFVMYRERHSGNNYVFLFLQQQFPSLRAVAVVIVK